MAQETSGKLEGVVRDNTGQPVSGAAVMVLATSFATLTNEQGYWFFNNVPAGLVTVQARMIGYAPAQSPAVRVFAGQTLTVSLVLEPRAVEIGEIVVTAQVAPIVPRDQVTSKAIVSGQMVNQLPVDNVSQVIRLQPGVVESQRGISIRGGRIGEAAIYIDGVPVRSVSGGTTPVTVAPNAVEEVSVTTGAMGPAQGDAQSGVISLVTRSGGRRLAGFLGYETDELGSDAASQGLHRLEASVGGPLAGTLSFFVATTLSGQQNGLQAKGAEASPVYAMSGVDTVITVAEFVRGSPTGDSVTYALPAFTRYSRGSRLPDAWSNGLAIDGKLSWSYGSGSNLSLIYHRTRTQGLSFRGRQLYNAAAQLGSRSSGQAAIINWAHTVRRERTRGLSLVAALSVQRDSRVAGPVNQQWLDGHRDPAFWFTPSDVRFVVDFENFPIDERLVRNIRVNDCEGGRDASRPQLAACVPYHNRTDLSTFAPFRANPYGSQATDWATTGLGTPAIRLVRETRFTARAHSDWQANRYNRLQAGGELVRASIASYQATIGGLGTGSAILYSPSRWALFAADRLDLGDLVLDVGLRYDRLVPDLLYPNYPGLFHRDPFRVRDGNLDQVLTNTARSAADSATARRCEEFRAAADTAGWSTCNLYPARNIGILLPSVRVSFPVTDQTGFRLSYAHQSQAPDFDLLSSGAGTGTGVHARDVTYGRTIIFEFGIRHAFSRDLVLDVAAYNKDNIANIAARILPVWDPEHGDTTHLNVFTNSDFGYVRGFDLRLDRRIGDLFHGFVSYSYQAARNTGSDPFEYLSTLAAVNSNVTGSRAPPPQAALETRDNRTHNLAGAISLHFPARHQSRLLAGTGIFATFRFASGVPYTRLENTGSGVRSPNFGGLLSTPEEPLNASHLPWLRNADLRVTRSFRLGAVQATAYADIRNVFNFTNLVAVFAETGGTVNSLHSGNFVRARQAVLRLHADSLFVTRQVPGGTASESGVDLSDCRRYQPTVTSGMADCLMLRRAEERFGDGDRFFSEAEQAGAFRADYDFSNGSHVFRGPGRQIRVGITLEF